MRAGNLTKEQQDQLEKEIAAVLNRMSLEGFSDTPDFLIARHLVWALMGFNLTMQARALWYVPSPPGVIGSVVRPVAPGKPRPPYRHEYPAGIHVSHYPLEPVDLAPGDIDLKWRCGSCGAFNLEGSLGRPCPNL